MSESIHSGSGMFFVNPDYGDEEWGGKRVAMS